MSQKYAAIAFRFIRHKYLSFGIIAAAVALLLLLVKATPTSLVPDEDTGMLYVNLTTKPGMTLNETDRALQQLDKKLAKIPGIAHRAKVSGYSFTAQGSNSGMFYVPLKPWNERGKGESLNDITEKINRAAADIAGASVVVMSPSLVSGFGMSSGFDLNLEDRNGGSISQFQQVKDRFVKELSRQPEIGSAYSHHAPWHVAPDGGYGSRSQWQPLISLLCGGWHGVGYPCPAFPRARPVHHLPVVARTADAKENGGVIEVNYSK